MATTLRAVSIPQSAIFEEVFPAFTTYVPFDRFIKATPAKTRVLPFERMSVVGKRRASAACDEVAAEAFAAGIGTEQTHACGAGTAAAAAGGTAVSAAVVIAGCPARALL